MALVVADRVKETTTTTGTGTITLAGAEPNFISFTSALSDGDTTYYAIVDDANSDFEVGLGTFTASGTTLARTTVLASSNSGSAVDLQSGTKEVFVNYPADKSVYLDNNNKLIVNGVIAVPVIKSANYTASAGEFIVASAGSITITLPASPSAGDVVTVKDGTGAAATTSFTVGRNGSNIASSATDLTFDKNFAEITMTYINSTIGWSV